MVKRIFLILFLTASLVIGLSGIDSVQSVLSHGLNQPNAAPSESGGKGGNGLVRVLKAPFKALGRLFGRKESKFHRLTEKDAEQFESSKFTRVVDAVETPTSQTTAPSDMGAAEHVERGRALLNANKLNEAIAELSLAASLDPKLAEAHSLLGVAYHQKGLRELARKSLEKASKLDKKNSQILNNLGFLLYTYGEYKDALEKLKKAARLAPDDARILNNLALAQSQLGKYDDAYKNFARAGGEIEGRLNMANRLEIAGLSEKAREHYEAARAKSEANQRNNRDAQAITVVMEIENGRVKYASVPNRRPGFAAYEATAIRIARSRRYATNKSGQESIVIRVQPMPAS